MASPGDKKGQRRGSCGHVMAVFDLHDKCARCREKLIGEDNCVKDKPCKICDGFTPAQKDMLATPSYKIRKDKKAGLLVSPKEVTVLHSVDNEPTFQSPSGQPSQSSAIPPSTPPSSSEQTASFVTSDQLAAIADKWSEQFVCMEALLSRGNVFSTPVSSVKPLDTHNLISDNPFLAPATRPTGPVSAPVAVDASVSVQLVDAKDKEKEKKKSHKSRKDRHADKTVKSDVKSSTSRSDKQGDEKPVKRHDRSPSPVCRSTISKAPAFSPPPDASSGPESAHQSLLHKGETSKRSSDVSEKTVTGSLFRSSSSTVTPPAQDASLSFAGTGACAFLQEPEHYERISENEMELSVSCTGSDDGHLSDVTDQPEQTEEMSYRETVRSVRAFMGWHHIPAFETDFSEPDKSNNPWKGKKPRKPTRISVAMPPDDWLCQKLEHLNLTVAEGYPSRSQDSAGLKRDQFIKVPKSQEKWYKMHLLKPEGTHRPGRSVFNWRNSEAKVNSQFPRITRASAYPSTGPPSRPIAQESLRRWERAAREDSYIVNHTAGFSRCSTELQEKMSQNIALLCSRLGKGKTSKEVSNALNDLRDLMAFHQKVSVAMGTSLQHLADSLFVNMANLVLLQRDAYLDFVKQGVKQDTMNLLRNAPLFGYGLFPDAAIMTAEQDIQKFETSSVAQRPGPGAAQHTNWKSSQRFKPYDRKDRKPASASDQSTQQQSQPWRQFGRSRPRGRGRGQGSNPRFSKGQSFKPYK